MQLSSILHPVLNQLAATLLKLTDEQYNTKCSLLNNSSIGGHTRHIIELFQCLFTGYDAGMINYDNRKRDVSIETNKQLAVHILNDIGNTNNMPDKALKLQFEFINETASSITVNTNFNREIIYNLEHTIHHMALIRIGIKEISDIRLPESFGVATSTIQYNNVCAQ